MKIISKEQILSVGSQLLADETHLQDFSLDSLPLLLECLRWDPRICEMTVSFFARNWKKINPLELYEINITQECPAALAVVLEHTLQFYLKTEKQIFKAWMKLVLLNCKVANNEQFFIGVYPFASSLMRENSEKPLKIFFKWGFYEQNLFLNKANLVAGKTTQASVEHRQQVLQHLSSAGKAFTVQNYLDEVGLPLSRRQAERDLQASPLFKKVGFTRRRKYVPKGI